MFQNNARPEALIYVCLTQPRIKKFWKKILFYCPIKVSMQSGIMFAMVIWKGDKKGDINDSHH